MTMTTTPPPILLDDRARDLVQFSVFIHVGGGLGDCAHHYAANPYFRVLRSVVKAFPRLRVYVYVESKIPHVVSQLFKADPSVNHVVEEMHRRGGWNWEHVEEFIIDTCGMTPEKANEYMPEFDGEIMRRRIINRICTLCRFPRIRAISMDDFFQQWDLELSDFEWEEPWVNVGVGAREKADRAIRIAGAQDMPLVMLHAYSADNGRACYPPASWLCIALALRTRGYAVAVFGGPQDGGHPFEPLERGYLEGGYIDLTHTEDLLCKIAVLQRCAGAICIDGSLMSLAWLHAIPTVTICSEARAGLRCNNTPDGYHWAIASEEPYAMRHPLSLEGKDASWDAEPIVAELEAILDQKGKRVSAGVQPW